MNEKKTARIYDFGTRRVARPRPAANDEPLETAQLERVEAQRGNPVIDAFRQLLFLVLMWLRWPVRFLLGLLAVPAMIAIPIVALGLDSPNKVQIVLSLVAVSFGAFLLRWFYDSLLMRLSNEPLFLS